MQSSHSSSLGNSFAINHASPWSTALHPENSLLSVGRSFGRASAGVDTANLKPIAFIDAGVTDYQSLVAGLQPGTEVHLLDTHRSAIAQITDTLMGRSGIESVHIVSHGQAGSLQLGADWLSWENLRSYTSELQTWGNALSADADILLYGCDIAGGTIGQSFVQQMAQLTGADVAASDDRTGSAALGGDWNLEFSTSEINAASVFGVDTTATYQHILPIDLISGVNPNLISDTASGGSAVTGNVSGNGRYVVFSSTANNLVENDTNKDEDIFLRDVQTGSTVLVSANQDGTASGNRESVFPEVSEDGRYVAFISYASNLVANDTNDSHDVFVRDIQTGITQLVSVNTSGTSSRASLYSYGIGISDNGRYVAFTSNARDLVANDTNSKQDVFVRDLLMGVTTLVSVNNTGTDSGNDISADYRMTRDGRYVTFTSTASNLVANDTNGSVRDVFIRDLVLGTTSLVSASSNGSGSGNSSSGAEGFLQISDNGRYVAFNSVSSNLVTNDTNGSVQDVFVRDLQTSTTTLVSVNYLGTGSGNKAVVSSPSISRDGRYVAFVSLASNLAINDTNNTYDVFVRDLELGTTTLVSTNHTGSGTGNGYSGSTGSLHNPVRLSSDGRYVSFVSAASNLVANDTNGSVQDVFIRDLLAGTTTIVSHTSTGNSGNGSSFYAEYSFHESFFSNDGRYIVFGSNATNLTAGDHNEFSDVFLYDVSADTVTLVSQRDLDIPSLTGAGLSNIAPNTVSADGRYVAFVSTVKNLVINDNNTYQDVFLHDRQTKTNTLISVDNTGVGSGNGTSNVRGISADGRYVLFESNASNLVANDTNAATDVFVRDLLTGTTQLVSVNSSGTGSGNRGSNQARISRNGRYVTFTSTANNLAVTNDNGGTSDIFVRDLVTGTTTLVSTNSAGTSSSNGSSSASVISDDGRYVAFHSTGTNLVGNTLHSSQDVFIKDLTTGITTLISTNGIDKWGGNDFSYAPVMSNDGRYIAFTSDATNLIATDKTSARDILLWDRQTSKLTLVSRTSKGSGGDSESSSPVMSGDGRYIAFESHAGLVANDFNSAIDIYVYDQQTDHLALVSHTAATGDMADGPSIDPVISQDGRFIAFESSARNLVANNNNGYARDIFVWDRQTDVVRMLSQTPIGQSGNNSSENPVISDDGTYVVFDSYASNLTVGDRNESHQSSDVFGVQVLPAIAINSATINQNEGTTGTTSYTVTVNLLHLSSETVTVNYKTIDNTATSANNDYTATSGTLTFHPGETSKIITVFITGDTTFESDETFNLVLSDAYGGIITKDRASLTITNDDEPPAYDFSTSIFVIVEGNTNNTAGLVTIVRSRATTIASSVDVILTGDSATAGNDFTATPITVRFQPGETQKTVPIEVQGDSTFEADEIVLLSLSNFAVNGLAGTSNGLAGTTRPTAFLGIKNDDQPPTYNFSTSTFTVAEGNTTRTEEVVTVVRSGDVTIASSVDVILNNGTTTPITVSFQPGETQKTVPIEIQGDSTLSQMKTVSLSLGNFTANGVVGTVQPTATLTITNDDEPPTYNFSTNTFTVAEGNTTRTVDAISIVRSGDTTIASSVDVILNNGSSPITVSFQPGETQKTVPIELRGDSTFEPDETVSLSLGNFSANGVVGTTQPTATLTITNDDQPPTYNFSTSTFTVAEGNTTRTVEVVTVVRSGDVTISSSVDVILKSGSATAGSDFTATPITVSFQAGETQKTVPIELRGDSTVEADETILLSLSNFTADGVVGTAQPTATLTLKNDDLAPRIRSDFDGDGKTDLVWRNYGVSGTDAGKVAIWTMNGVTPKETVTMPFQVTDTNWRIEGTGDFNADGQQDLVWRYYGTTGPDVGKVSIWTMNGVNPVQTVVMPFLVPDVNWKIEGIADFDRDGKLDLVWRNYGTRGTDAGKVAIWTMNGVNPVQTIYMPFVVPDVNWKIDGVADFNHDGNPDLLWRHYGTSGTDAGKVVIWTMNGVSPMQTVEMPFKVSDTNWRIEGVGDFNGDGKADLVWRHYGTSGMEAGKVVIWTMNGINPVQTVEMPFRVTDPYWQIVL